ncbi:uncharacterized protein PHACADRAFT_33973, partial [Phanerochaete carnosa HHB-10118-sp]
RYLPFCKSILAYNFSQLNLCINGWTAPNVIFFLEVTVQYVIDGYIKSVILNFIWFIAYQLSSILYRSCGKRLAQGHTGVYLGKKLIECLKLYGIKKKKGSSASETNEENDNDSLSIESNDNAEAIDKNDEYKLDADCEAADIASIEEIIEEIEKKYNLTEEKAHLSCTAVTKLTELAKHVFHSPTLHKDLAASCEKQKLTSKEMIFLKATKQVLKLVAPLLHEGVPLIDTLTTHLKNVIVDSSLVKPMCAVAACGLRMLNKYYSKTNESVIYWIAINWIDEAKHVFCEQWELHYKLTDTLMAGSTVASQVCTLNCVTDSYANYYSFMMTSANGDDNFFAEIDAFNMHITVDPMGDHPLVCMGLDYLSAPAASTDIECAFSHGGLAMSKHHHALSDEFVHAASVLKFWAGLKGVIPEEKIIKVFWNKSKQPKELTEHVIEVD